MLHQQYVVWDYEKGNNSGKDSSALNAEGAVSAGIQVTVILPDGSQKQMIVYAFNLFQLKTSSPGADYPHLDCYKVVLTFRDRRPVDVPEDQEFDQELLQEAKDIHIVPISANKGGNADTADNTAIDSAIHRVL